MKSICTLLAICMTTFTSMAQPTNDRGWYDRKDVENVQVGWMNTLTFKEPAKPFAQYGWSYPAKQTDCTQKFITWIQQSYTCKGLLGEPKLSVLAPEPALPKTNSSYGYGEAEKDNRKALPNTYGGYVRFHHNLVKTSTKKFAPMNGNMSYMTLNMMANNVELFTRQIVSLSGEDDYYCTIPRYAKGMKGEFDRPHNEELAGYRNFTNSPALKKYDHYFVPGQALSGRGAFYVIVMTKDRQPLPFEQVTIGEFLTRLESRLPTMYTLTKNGGSQLPNLLEKAKAGLQELKKQFKDYHDKFAYFRGLHENVDMIDLANIDAGKPITWLKTEAESKERDYGSSNYALLRLKKGVKEACATSGPQWIVFRMEAMVNAADAGNIELMDNFINSFNYDYVYDYYFGKDKVITAYQPNAYVSPEEKNNNQAPAVLSETAKKYSADRSVLFFEDFSGVAIDAAPSAWTNERNQSGERIGVKEVAGIGGKWLKLQKNAAPKQFNPVSGDFDLSFDVMVQKGDVPWGTPGIRAEMRFGSSKGDKNLVLDVSPGDMNRKDAQGWVMITLPSADCKIGNYYSLPDFTGSKPINKVTMTLRRRGNTAVILCNNNKVYDCGTAFADEMNMKSLNFYVNEKNSYYISNILVKK